jgi:tRNA pseudouridine38-40 synthase
MCALLVGYQGTGFCGLQVNPGVPTVEQTILDALIRVGYLPPTSPNELHRHGWQRASRTDKGVHAARNVLGIRLCVAEDVTDDTIVTTLNQELPSVIRILGVLRTTKHFNAKTEASRRVYQYVVPTFAFLNDYARYFPEPLGDFVGSEAPEEDSDPEAPPKPSKQEDNFHLAEVPLPAGSFEALAQYRISPERLARVRALLKGYEGTQSYHNFTKRMKATDPQAMRYIIGFSCSDPYELDGIELVTLEVNGQSFLLNQIRKMVGLVMIMVSADLPDDVLHCALDPAHTLNIPPAPGLNLLLLDLAFDRYRHRLQHDTNGRRPIEWPEKDEEVAAFRASLCRHIVTLERTNHTACRWMYALRRNVHRFLGLRLPSEPPLPPVADIPPETAA